MPSLLLPKPTLLKNVAVETLTGRLTKAHGEHAVIADAKVQHAKLHAFLSFFLCFSTRHFVELKAHLVGPAVLMISGGTLSVGDAIAKDGDSAHVACVDIEGSNVEPLLVTEGTGEVGRGLALSF